MYFIYLFEQQFFMIMLLIVILFEFLAWYITFDMKFQKIMYVKKVQIEITVFI